MVESSNTMLIVHALPADSAAAHAEADIAYIAEGAVTGSIEVSLDHMHEVSHQVCIRVIAVQLKQIAPRVHRIRQLLGRKPHLYEGREADEAAAEAAEQTQEQPTASNGLDDVGDGEGDDDWRQQEEASLQVAPQQSFQADELMNDGSYPLGAGAGASRKRPRPGRNYSGLASAGGTQSIQSATLDTSAGGDEVNDRMEAVIGPDNEVHVTFSRPHPPGYTTDELLELVQVRV
jgi:hypothetical protein